MPTPIPVLRTWPIGECPRAPAETESARVFRDRCIASAQRRRELLRITRTRRRELKEIVAAVVEAGRVGS